MTPSENALIEYILGRGADGDRDLEELMGRIVGSRAGDEKIAAYASAARRAMALRDEANELLNGVNSGIPGYVRQRIWQDIRSERDE